MSSDILTISIAFLVSANCSMVGCFLVVRRQTMIGDAIAHAVLPGIVVAFIISKSTASFPLLIGAIIAGIATTLLIGFLREHIKVPQDAAIGISFTFFFALGILLLSLYAHNVDLDVECVLYGELLSLHFDRFIWQHVDMGPRAIYLLGLLLFINSLLIFIFYPTLLMTSFDEHFAKVVGVRTTRWNDGFMVLVSINIVLMLQMVGAPLVIGFIAVPAATAYLFSNQLISMILYSLVIDGIMATNGYHLARALESSVPGAIICVGGVLFSILFVVVNYSAKKSVRKRNKKQPLPFPIL